MSKCKTYECGEEECVHPEFDSCNECINKPSKHQQPAAGDFTKKFRQHLERERKSMGFAIWTRSKEACDRLDTSEASRKDLLKVCECALSSIKLRLICGKGEDPEMERDMIMILLEAAIAKAK